MKVIKNNTLKHQVICHYCKSILEYDNRDIYDDLETNRLYKGIFCPCCDKFIILSIDDKPFDYIE